MSSRVLLLGTPHLWNGAERFELVGGKLTALLSFLAYSDTTVSRSSLLTLLWHDQKEARVRANLRQLLLLAKRLPYAADLAVTETHLEWQGSSDVRDFRRHFVRREWPDVIRLYNGDLLSGFSGSPTAEFDLWLEDARRELALQHRHAIFALGRELTRTQKASRAADVYRRLVRADILDEEALRAYLQALSVSGQNHLAQAAYTEFLHLLDREVGGEPERATLDVAEELRLTENLQASDRVTLTETAPADASRDLALAEERRRRPDRRRHQAALPERLVGLIGRSRAHFFRGREGELQRLRQALRASSVGLVQLCGHGGIGKTALATKFLLDLAAEDPAVSPVDALVYVSLRESGGRLSEGIINLLSRTLTSDLAAELRNLWGSAHSFPNKLEAVLGSVLRRHPTVIFFDDFEAVLTDSGTFRDEHEELRMFIEICLEHSAPVFLVLASRKRVVFSAETEGRLSARRLELYLTEGLAAQEAVGLLRDLDGDGRLGVQGAEQAVLDDIVRRCHGVPRLLETLIGTLKQRRTMTLGRFLETPGGLTSLIENPSRDRYERLPGEDKRIMQVLAVYDRGVPAGAVSALLPGVETESFLDRLVDNLLVNYDATAGLYSLHPSDQSYSYQMIVRDGGDARRSQLHAEAAGYFASLRKPDREVKGLADLWPQLQEFDQLVRAGRADEACRLLSHYSDCCLRPWGHASLVVRLHRQLQDNLTDGVTRALGLGNLSSAYAELGQYREALAAGEEALALYKEHDRFDKKVRLIGSLGVIYMQSGNLGRAHAYIQEGLQGSRALRDTRGELINLMNLTLYCQLKADFPAALRHANTALELAHTLAAADIRAQLLNSLGVIYTSMGLPRQALEPLSLAAKACEENLDRPLLATVHDSLGESYLATEQYDLAAKHFRRAADLAEEVGDLWLLGTVQKHTGTLRHRLGKARAALMQFRQALVRFRELGDEPEEGTVLNLMALVYQEQGDVDTASALRLASCHLLQQDGRPVFDNAVSGQQSERLGGQVNAFARKMALKGNLLLYHATGHDYSSHDIMSLDSLQRQLTNLDTR